MSDEETTTQTATAIIEHEERLARLREDDAILGSQLAAARESLKSLKVLRAQRGEISSAALAPDEARIANLERRLRDNRDAIAEELRRRPGLDARHEAAMARAREMPEYLRREAAKGRAAVAAGRTSSETLDRRIGRPQD